MKDFDKKEQAIGIIVNEQLSQLVALSEYNAEDDLEQKEAEIGEDGVAVVFVEEDQDDEGFKIREESMDEEEQEDGENHWNIVECATIPLTFTQNWQ